MVDFYGYVNTVQLDLPDDVSSEYPFNIPTLRNFKKLIFDSKVTYLVGENGMGKSTGLYILDEPESALSITRQMAMLAQMDKLVNKKSQFIIATHSPIVLAYPDATIYQMTTEGIHQVKYKETDTYRLYKGFLDNPEQMTSILLS